MHFLITAGGTKEYIDPVRFISNASSGRMGYALAKAAIDASHQVTLITTMKERKIPEGAKAIQVTSAADMFDAVSENFKQCDCLIMAAAVADYTPAKISEKKIKKEKLKVSLELVPTVDILKWAGQNKQTQKIVGFALEDTNLRDNAEKKLAGKNLDMIIANTPAAIGAQKSQVEIKTADAEWIELSFADKSVLAKRIIEIASNL